MVEERGSSRGNREDRGSSRGSSWGSCEDRGSSHGGKGMSGPNTPKPRLQRLSAKKDREYQADLNSSTDFDDDNSHFVRSPGRSPMTRDNKTFTRQDSFRVGGNEDDLQKLYEFLGVESPAGLGIEASAWEARKSSINSRPPSPRGMTVDSGQTSISDEFKGFQASSFGSGSPPSPRLSPMRPIERDWKVYREHLFNSKQVKPDVSPARRSPPTPTEFPGTIRVLTRSTRSIDNSTVPHISLNSTEGTLLSRRHTEPFTALESPPSSARADFTGAHAPPGDGAVKAPELELRDEGAEPARRSSFFINNLPSAAVAMPTSGRRSSLKDPTKSRSHGSLRWRSSTQAPEAESIVNPAEEIPVVSGAVTTEARETPENQQVQESSMTLTSSGDSIEGLPDVAPKNPSWTSWAKGELLGSGTFGTVYEGVGSNGTFFAVKEVPLSDQGRAGKQAIRQLEQEIALLSKIQHPNIVQYLGTERDDEKLYIFLELVSKGSLAHVYNKYEFFYDQVRSYTKQILAGLKYLHDKTIIHRDIKCANILVDSSGVVKLADFGMAKQTDKLGLLKSFMGSAHWMAPEVVNPKRSYNLMADIWSLGCTVLEMAIGKPPFGELEAHGVLWKVGHGEGPPIPDDLPEDLKSFISNCLEVNVALRPTCDLLMTHPFITGVPMTGPVKLVSAPELSSIAEERSIDLSSNTSTASNVGATASSTPITDKVTDLHLSRGQPKSMRTRRGSLTMSSSESIGS